MLPLSALDPADPFPHGRPRTASYRIAFTTTGTVALAGVLLGTARAALNTYAGTPGGSRLDTSAHPEIRGAASPGAHPS